MRRRRLTVALLGLLLFGVGVALVGRVVLVRRATPDLVARWLRDQADRAALPLTFGEIRPAGPGAFTIPWIELRLGDTADPSAASAVRLRAEDVRIAYDVAALRTPRVRVRDMRVARLDVALALPPRRSTPADASAMVDAAAIERAVTRLAALLAGADVSVGEASVGMAFASGAEVLRYTGTGWTALVAPRGDAWTATWAAQSAASPAVRVEGEVMWRQGAPVHITLTGAVPDAGDAWREAGRVWPAVAGAPLRVEGGALTWQATVRGLGRPDWRVEGTAAFSALRSTGRAGLLPESSGTCTWVLAADPAAGGLALESLTLQSTSGDATVRGVVGWSEGERVVDAEVQLLGLSGAQCAAWLAAFPWPADGLFGAVDTAGVEAVAVDLRLAGRGKAVTARGTVRVGAGAFRLHVAQGLPYLALVELVTPQVEFVYDAATGAASGRLKLVDGTLQFSALELAGHRVQGELEFGPDALRFAPLMVALPGADVTVRGTLPLRAADPVDLQVEAEVQDMYALAAPFQMPPGFRLSGAARLQGTVTGPAATLESNITLDGTDLDFAIGQVAKKPAGDRAMVGGVFRRRGAEVRGDVTVNLGHTQLAGVLIATPRDAPPASAATVAPLARWDFLVGVQGDAVPLSSLRRLSPVTRILRGYGTAELSLVYESTAAGRTIEAWMDADEVRCEHPRSPVQLAVSNSLWYLRSDPERRINRLTIDGERVDVVEPLTPVGAPGPVPVTHTASGWETLVDFGFDRGTWRRLTGTALTGRLNVFQGQVELERLSAQAFGGTVRGAIALDSDDVATVSVAWNDCDVDAVLTQVYDIEGAARGVMHGQFHLGGRKSEWPRWEGGGQVTVDVPWVAVAYFADDAQGLPLRSVSADFASARFTFADGMFGVPQLAIERPGVSITGRGTIRLDGDMRLKCFARVDNALVERLPLLARVQYTRPVSPETREIEFTLRDNIRHLRPKVKRRSVPSMLGDFGVGSVTRSGRLLLDLLGL